MTEVRNYEAIVQCLSSEVGERSESNPLDFFISLNFDPENLRSKSKSVCAKLQASNDNLECAKDSNKTLASFCAAGFTRGLLDVFGLHKERRAPQDVLRGIACSVTKQTTFCIKDTLPGCSEDVRMTLIGYYSIFTNETCIAQPGEELPQRVPNKNPKTALVKCTQEAEEKLSSEQPEPKPTSLAELGILRLKTNCKTYMDRYTCYERELENITNFMDFWLSLTFDRINAENSQKNYCSLIDEHVIPKLTNECFEKSQPALDACEEGFVNEVETIRREWFNNTDFDGLQLQTLACRTSVIRATCFGNAMQHCGEDVARAMALSEMGVLPDICRRLLAQEDDRPPNQGKQPDSGPPHTHKSETQGGSHYKNTDVPSGSMDNMPKSRERPTKNNDYTPVGRSSSSSSSASSADDTENSATRVEIGIILLLSLVCVIVAFE
ncbi:uncharacterized protein LOC101850554 [Aplysia californica]|uniref:Uncharacterized protein LOC101850554 n=1 Tax=Aplysia californica TaxID=6500 RepID=A0ABM1VRL3_APLCA|nr:uncharacterized protein LOC101850554 [Aplysia californica]